jgi:hypothetical protein
MAYNKGRQMNFGAFRHKKRPLSKALLYMWIKLFFKYHRNQHQ